MDRLMHTKLEYQTRRPLGVALGFLIVTTATVCACASADGEPGSENVDRSAEALKKVDLNECACIDLTQIEDCRAASTCASYTNISGQYDTYYCKRTKTNFKCPKVAEHLCRIGGYPPNGIKCCNGAEYVGSLLLCK